MIPARPRFLTVAEVSRLADMWVGGGTHGRRSAAIHDLGALTAAVLRPGLDVDGERIYRDEYEQAAALMHALITSRPFGREVGPEFGLYAAIAALHANDIKTEPADPDYGGRLVDLVVSGQDDISVIAAHLEQVASGRLWRGVLPDTGEGFPGG